MQLSPVGSRACFDHDTKDDNIFDGVLDAQSSRPHPIHPIEPFMEGLPSQSRSNSWLFLQTSNLTGCAWQLWQHGNAQITMLPQHWSRTGFMAGG